MAKRFASDFMNDSSLFDPDESEDDQVLSSFDPKQRMTGKPPAAQLAEQKRKKRTPSASANVDPTYQPSSEDDETPAESPRNM